jgi:hypothetical protein
MHLGKRSREGTFLLLRTTNVRESAPFLKVNIEVNIDPSNDP